MRNACDCLVSRRLLSSSAHEDASAGDQEQRSRCWLGHIEAHDKCCVTIWVRVGSYPIGSRQRAEVITVVNIHVVAPIVGGDSEARRDVSVIAEVCGSIEEVGSAEKCNVLVTWG